MSIFIYFDKTTYALLLQKNFLHGIWKLWREDLCVSFEEIADSMISKVLKTSKD